MGRNARNVSAELLQLYQISNQQKQLLDGINSALVDGIVLTDKGGMVQYANQAFARMVGRSDENLWAWIARRFLAMTPALRLCNSGRGHPKRAVFHVQGRDVAA